MAAGTFVGHIAFIGEPENVGKKKPFYKRTFVVDDTDDDRYDNPVPFELTQSDINLIDGYKVGDEVKVQYYLNGRAWNDPKSGKTRYFLSAKVVQIAPLSGVGEGGTDAETDADAAAQEEGVGAGSPDELPF